MDKYVHKCMQFLSFIFHFYSHSVTTNNKTKIICASVKRVYSKVPCPKFDFNTVQ